MSKPKTCFTEKMYGWPIVGTPSSKRKQKTERITDAEAEKLYRLARKAPALLTRKQLHDMEKGISEDRFGITRRCVLATLTEPCARLIDAATKDRELAAAHAEFSVLAREYKLALRSLLQLIEAAETRLMFSLINREDMPALMAKAVKRNGKEARVTS